MNKTELLSKVTRGPKSSAWVQSKAVLGAAEHGVSDSAVTARRAQLELRRKHLTATICTAVAAALTVFVLALWRSHLKASDQVAVSVVFILGCILGAGLLEWMGRIVGHLEEHFWLDPVAGTVLCQYGVKAVEHSSWARQWRDLALQDRSELRRFDISVMSVLSTQQKAEEAEADSQARIDSACRTLHAIPAVADA